MEERIKNWIWRLSNEEFPHKSIIALYFGLFEIENGICVYLTGSKNYDACNDDWACDVDYKPKDEYLEIKVDEGVSDWKKIMEKVIEAISNSINSKDICDSFLFKDRIITVGFDDGPLERIK